MFNKAIALALQREVLRIKVMNTDIAVLSATCEAASVPGVRKRIQNEWMVISGAFESFS
jgi:hypothetical protein